MSGRRLLRKKDPSFCTTSRADDPKTRAGYFTDLRETGGRWAVSCGPSILVMEATGQRIVLVALAAVTPTWRNVLRIVQPEIPLRWHRAGFKALWLWRSRTRPASRAAGRPGVEGRRVGGGARRFL
jgi:hypothetical protein